MNNGDFYKPSLQWFFNDINIKMQTILIPKIKESCKCEDYFEFNNGVRIHWWKSSLSGDEIFEINFYNNVKGFLELIEMTGYSISDFRSKITFMNNTCYHNKYQTYYKKSHIKYIVLKDGK